MVKQLLFTAGLSIAVLFSAMAQDDWGISAKDAEKVSPFKFDDAAVTKGQEIYTGNCAGCHGQVGQNNFAPLVPEPGDPGSERFQSQTDGQLFYKIRNGKGAMPSFKDKLSEEERWQLIAFIRSGNEQYVQPEPKVAAGGFDLKSISFEVIANEAGDSIKVTVNKPDTLEGLEASVSAKRWFGNLPLGKSFLSEGNTFVVPFDKTLPGDSVGNVDIILRLSLEGSGRIEVPTTLQIGTPSNPENILDGRHLWSVRSKAPIWLYIAYFGMVLGAFGTMGYIVMQLLKIKQRSSASNKEE